MDTKRLSSGLQDVLLPTLVVVLGLQSLRRFIPGMVWYLMDTVGVGTFDLLPYAFGTFFLGFLAALLNKLLGSRFSLWVSAGGLAVLRVCEQGIKDPGVDLWVGAASVGLFLIFIPLYIGWTRSDSDTFPERWALGLILGFGLDTALRGLFGFQELSIIPGWIPLGLTVLLAALVIWSLGHDIGPGASSRSEGSGKSVLLLLGLGPYLLLQMLYLQNMGWLEQITGLAFPAGFLMISIGYAISALGLAVGLARPRSLHPSLSIGSGLLLTYCIYYADQLGIAALALVILGQFVLGWGLAGIVKPNQEAKHKTLWRTTLAVTGGMLLFLILSFAYYAAQDISLPISRASFPALAAGIFALLAVWGSFQSWRQSKVDWNLSGTLAASTLILVPLICWGVWSAGPSLGEPSGFPVRVMDYNIHSAFNAEGAQDLEAIAAVIEDSGADIIGLQEVSRTRLMDGGLDMPTWLARRLEMEMIFAGTEEPIWGNAILSRYPILDSGYQELPRGEALIGRGYLWAEIDIGEAEPLLVVVTHLHHLVPDSQIRLAQVPVILEFLDGKDQVIFLGDLNAEPDFPEMSLIYESDLLDAWLEAGEGLGYTVDSDDPHKRIDYLWHSPDLRTLEIEVIQTRASDHMPVVGLFENRK